MKKISNKALTVILAAIMIMSSVPIGSIAKTVSGSPIAIIAEAASKKTHLNATKKSVYIGKKYTLKLIDKKGKTISASKVKWSTADKSVATVSKKGVVTAKKAGKVKITATYKGKKYNATITVNSTLSLNKTKLTFKIGETAKKTIKVTRKDNNDIKWTVVSGKNIVKISQAKNWKNNSKNLYITPTGKKYGEVKIKVYSAKNSNNCVYLNVDVKAPYTLKVKNNIPCTINNYSSEYAYETGRKNASLKITKLSYKTPDTKTLNVTLDYEISTSLKPEDYFYIKYRVLDKNGFLVESAQIKSKLMMVGDKAKAEISLKDLKNGSYTIEFKDYIGNSTTTVPDATVPDTTVPDTTVPDTTVPDTTVPDTTVPDTTVPDTTVPDTTVPDTTVPDTTVPDTTVPDTNEPPDNKLTDKEIVNLYKNAVNSARTEATSVIRVKDGALNYKGIIEAGTLSSTASSLVNMFFVANEDEIEIKNEALEKELLPDAGELTVNGLRKIAYEDAGDNYIVTLVAKDVTNPEPGSDGVGAISNVIEESDITDATSSIPNLQISNLSIDYENVTTIATIDKATGRLLNLEIDAPCILYLDIKAFTVTLSDAKVGIETISEYAVYYGNEPDNNNNPDDVTPPIDDGNLTVDEALAMYQKAAKDIHTKGVAGYSLKSWQTVDSISTSNSTLNSTLQNLLQGFLTTEEDAEIKVNEKGSDDAKNRMPISDCSKEYINNVTATRDGDNYIITIVMKDVTNPGKNDTDGLNLMSRDFLYMEDVHDTVKNDSSVKLLVKSLDKAEITYKAYTITATMTKDGKFINIKHYGPGYINADMQLITGNTTFSGTINFNAEYFDFKY